MKQEEIEEVAKSEAFEFSVDYKPFETDLDYREYAQYGFGKGFKEGAKWQQEQDNKELGMWKLAVEKQEARCKALNGVISDLQERMYSEEEVLKLVDGAFHMYASSKRHDAKEWLVEQFKKK